MFFENLSTGESCSLSIIALHYQIILIATKKLFRKQVHLFYLKCRTPFQKVIECNENFNFSINPRRAWLSESCGIFGLCMRVSKFSKSISKLKADLVCKGRNLKKQGKII